MFLLAFGEHRGPLLLAAWPGLLRARSFESLGCTSGLCRHEILDLLDGLVRTVDDSGKIVRLRVGWLGIGCTFPMGVESRAQTAV